MRLIDVNVLVYAFRTDAREHDAFAAWLEELVNSDEAYAVSDMILSGFLRVVTHPRVLLGQPQRAGLNIQYPILNIQN